MNSFPANDLRSNFGTWAIVTGQLPGLAARMRDALPGESFDPDFHGQLLTTTYFDTSDFDLKKTRAGGGRYLVLRLRRYDPGPAFAVSVKTEKEKFRAAVQTDDAEALLAGADLWPDLLPAHLSARLLELTSEPVRPVIALRFCRYAVENDTHRLTLDVGVETDLGKCLPYHVLEWKATKPDLTPPLAAGDLRPTKLSKFLWSLT